MLLPRSQETKEKTFKMTPYAYRSIDYIGILRIFSIVILNYISLGMKARQSMNHLTIPFSRYFYYMFFFLF